MTAIEGHAWARIGLLGNPSDGYEGRVLGLTIRDFSARVLLEPSAECRIVLSEAREIHAHDWASLYPMQRAAPDSAGAQLLIAAVARFDAWRREQKDAAHEELEPCKLSFESDIPRQVGMAGSSAIIIATLRCLTARAGLTITRHALAELALEAETEGLGITAGPQDRVLQAYEDFLFMDFAHPLGEHSYRRLDTKLLPPLFIAWDSAPGACSGAAHNDVRERYDAGDPTVRAAIARFPQLADEGLAALERGDHAAFRAAVDANFDTRTSIWPLSERDLEMIAIGRGAGAAVKFTGSGGAAVGVMQEPGDFAAIAAAYERAGFNTCVPTPAIAETSD